jgi:hypothetical protein
MFCTYAHYTPQGRLFYIGKGSSERRAHYMQGRNNYWNKIVAKYGNPRVEILSTWGSEKEAFIHEVLLISCFRDMGYELANLTDGGDGTSGYKQTEEHKEKLRKARTGKPIHSEEFKQRLSNLHKGNKWRQGLPASDKQKAIASALSKGNKHAAGNANNRKWVWVGTHIETGVVVEFIGEQAMKEVGIQHANVINCINGKRKSHKGYTWTKELLGNK